MDILKCKDSNHAARIAHLWLKSAVDEVGAKSVYLPAGSTPIPLYSFWEKNHPDFLSKLSFVQVDDILVDSHRDYFKNFFIEHLPSYQNQFFWVEDGPKRADLAILGLGVNGHVAFHEPGVSEAMNWSCVKLDDQTCKNLGLPHSSWGVTHGLGHFLAAKKVAIIATGKSKQQMVEKVLKFDKSIPAGWCAGHADFTLIADQDALPSGSDLQALQFAPDAPFF